MFTNDSEFVKAVQIAAEREGATEEDLEVLGVLLEAFGVYLSRNAVYGTLWKRFGYIDSLHHMRSKMARTMNMYMNDGTPTGSADLDSPIDLINFCAFFICNVRSENKYGDPDVI